LIGLSSFHLLVGEDAMSCDALFQLGMGPVELDATQTEDFSRLRPERARNASFRRSYALPRPVRLQGNRTKALIQAA